MLKEDIIEPSCSPWRAQVVVVKNENRKKRLVVDFSQTINRFTLLEAYPLPNIEELVNKVARYKYFSVIDLSSAYYQIEITKHERSYTAFQAGSNLYQFKRMPMGVTNAVPVFQKFMNSFIVSSNLSDIFAYLDDLVVCGRSLEEHDTNLRSFQRAADEINLQLNNDKSTFRLTTISWLGYQISEGVLRPDPERLSPLMNMPVPKNAKTLQRVVGLFAYYAKWIHRYSDKIQPLLENSKFPMTREAVDAFLSLRDEIFCSLKAPIDQNSCFTVECDASEVAIGGVLLQNDKPVSFFSRSLSKSERNYPIVEKEALAVVECVKKWRYLLAANKFCVVTDQQAVSYMYDQKTPSKTKNERILRWRLELAGFVFSIKYRPGKFNLIADALSRDPVFACSISQKSIEQVHSDLNHPGVTRMMHYIRSKNLPFSVEDVKRTVSSCPVCAKIKPRFFRKEDSQFIKALAPFDRLNIDFKGPLPKSRVTSNRYILTIIDEWSRFPFAIPCASIDTKSVIEALHSIFVVFGFPHYIHSDRGSSFMSAELKNYLTHHGISTSRTTPYHPQGNPQAERFNSTIWTSVRLALESRQLPINAWEEVLPDALHSIRSLLCVATNQTPHQRLFSYERGVCTKGILPYWLTAPGKIWLKKYNRNSKHDPALESVDLVHSNPDFAVVRFENGREETVSTRDLAPSGEEPKSLTSAGEEPMKDDAGIAEPDSPLLPEGEQTSDAPSQSHEDELQSPILPRRSSRTKRPVERLQLRF